MFRFGTLLGLINSRFGGSNGPSEVVILPETETTVDAEAGQAPIMTPLSATPTAGATAKVTYNGTEYISPIIQQVDEGGLIGYMVGNTDALAGLPGGNPDAPFAVALIPAGMEGMYGVIFTLEDVPSITLSIVQTEGAASGGESEGGGSGVFRVNAVVGSGNAITSCDKTVQEVLAAIAAGKQCEAVLSSGTLTIYLQLAMDAISAHSDPGAANGVTFTALLYGGSAILYNFIMYFNGNNTLDIKQF